MARAYYNEIDPAAAHVLECLIKDGIIADGDVDRRSITEVDWRDVSDYEQAHFFAGGGLWSVAARFAGWPDDRPLWTGSCPCQPFSVAGKGKGVSDERHLWPHFFRLIRSCRPIVIVGEQVAGKAGYGWFDGVRSDLEREGYASRAVDVPACAINAPHIRQRLYWVAMGNADLMRQSQSERLISDERRWTSDASKSVEYADGSSVERRGLSSGIYPKHNNPDGGSLHSAGSFWNDAEWIAGADGKSRRVKPGLRLLDDGISGRVGQLRIAGNAIVPPLAAEVLAALMETL